MSDFVENPFVWVGIGSSFVFSGLFYHLYQNKKEEVNKLKEIPMFKPDQQLVDALRASPHRRLQYVAVEGLVQADADPLLSHFVPRCFGVIQKISVEEQWKYWNSYTRTWNTRPSNKKETNNSVPFSLVNAQSYIKDIYIRVHEPLQAAGHFLDRIHHKTSHPEEDVVSIVLQGISGEKPGPLVEQEEMLTVGSTLTGFGEVVLEGDQGMRLRAPQDNRRYILIPGDYRSFMERQERSANVWKCLSGLTGITGASVLAAVVYNLVQSPDTKSK